MQDIKRRKLPKLRRTLGVIFQDFRLIDKMTVYENVAFAMRVVGASNKEIRRRVPQVLELVGLVDREKRYPAELSGGYTAYHAYVPYRWCCRKRYYTGSSSCRGDF